MENYDERRFRSVEETIRFLDDNACPGSAVAAAKRRLVAAHAALVKLKRQEWDARDLLPWDGKEIRRLFDALRGGHMLQVSRAAKRIRGFDKFSPGAAAALRVPHRRATPDVLVAAAERMAKWLKPHAATFVEVAGFDRAFLKDLLAATRTLKVRAKTTDSARRARTVALAAIKVELANGRKDIELLRVLLVPWLRENPYQRHRWNKVTSVRPKMGRPRKKRGGDAGAPPASAG